MASPSTSPRTGAAAYVKQVGEETKAILILRQENFRATRAGRTHATTAEALGGTEEDPALALARQEKLAMARGGYDASERGQAIRRAKQEKLMQERRVQRSIKKEDLFVRKPAAVDDKQDQKFDVELNEFIEEQVARTMSLKAVTNKLSTEIFEKEQQLHALEVKYFQDELAFGLNKPLPPPPHLRPLTDDQQRTAEMVGMLEDPHAPSMVTLDRTHWAGAEEAVVAEFQRLNLLNQDIFRALADAARDADSRVMMLRRYKAAEPLLRRRKQRLEAELTAAERDAAPLREQEYKIAQYVKTIQEEVCRKREALAARRAAWEVKRSALKEQARQAASDAQRARLAALTMEAHVAHTAEEKAEVDRRAAAAERAAAARLAAAEPGAEDDMARRVLEGTGMALSRPNALVAAYHDIVSGRRLAAAQAECSDKERSRAEARLELGRQREDLAGMTYVGEGAAEVSAGLQDILHGRLGRADRALSAAASKHTALERAFNAIKMGLASLLERLPPGIVAAAATESGIRPTSPPPQRPSSAHSVAWGIEGEASRKSVGVTDGSVPHRVTGDGSGAGTPRSSAGPNPPGPQPRRSHPHGSRPHVTAGLVGGLIHAGTDVIADVSLAESALGLLTTAVESRARDAADAAFYAAAAAEDAAAAEAAASAAAAAAAGDDGNGDEGGSSSGPLRRSASRLMAGGGSGTGRRLGGAGASIGSTRNIRAASSGAGVPGGGALARGSFRAERPPPGSFRLPGGDRSSGERGPAAAGVGERSAGVGGGSTRQLRLPAVPGAVGSGAGGRSHGGAVRGQRAGAAPVASAAHAAVHAPHPVPNAADVPTSAGYNVRVVFAAPAEDDGDVSGIGRLRGGDSASSSDLPPPSLARPDSRGGGVSGRASALFESPLLEDEADAKPADSDDDADREAYKRGEIDLKTGLNRRRTAAAAEAKELARKRRAIEMARKGSSIKTTLLGKAPIGM